MFLQQSFGPNDEELDDYRDFDDEHDSAKLDEVETDEDDDEEIDEPPAAAPGL